MPINISQKSLYKEIYRKNAGAQSEHPDQAPAFTATVRTPQCGHTVRGPTYIYLQCHRFWRIHEGIFLELSSRSNLWGAWEARTKGLYTSKRNKAFWFTSAAARVGLRFKAPHMHRMGMEVWGRVNKCKQDRKLHLHSLTTIFNDFTILHPSSFWGLLCKIFGWWSGFFVSIQALWARAHMGKPWHWTIAGTEAIAAVITERQFFP